MQDQVEPTAQKIRQKYLFLALWIFENRRNSGKRIKNSSYLGLLRTSILLSLKESWWPHEDVEHWKTLGTINIWNSKSIQQSQLQKITNTYLFGSLIHSKCTFVTKNLLFGSLDHSKMHFEWSSMRGTTAKLLTASSTI